MSPQMTYVLLDIAVQELFPELAKVNQCQPGMWGSHPDVFTWGWEGNRTLCLGLIRPRHHNQPAPVQGWTTKHLRVRR